MPLEGVVPLPHFPRFFTSLREACWQKLEGWGTWTEHLLSSLSPTVLGREVEMVSNAYTINLLLSILKELRVDSNKKKCNCKLIYYVC